MGGYLSEPIKDKESADFESDRLLCGASSMQGWRENQEDAHNCCLNYDENVALFAVYDGHGGQEVAQYCEKNLPDFIKNTEAYKNGDYEKALIDGFLGFDATIIKPEVIKVLEQMSGRKLEGSDVEDESEENVKDLFLEAKMPLDQLVAKYRQEGAKFKFDSPALKPRKNDAAAGPSTSTSDDGDISSSSSQAGCSKSSQPSSSTSNGELPLVNGDAKHDEDSADKAESSGKSPAKNQSEESGGGSSKSEAASSSKVEVGGSSSKAEVDGSSSKAEVDGSSSKAEVDGSSLKAEVGGSLSKAKVGGSSKCDEPDSSGEPKASKPEVSSTSNGEVEEHLPNAGGDISSSSGSAVLRSARSLTRKLLMNNDVDSDSDSDDVDFEGERPSDEEEDDDEGDSVAVEMGDDDDEDDDDEEEEEEEEDDEDEEEDEDDARLSVLPEEPGMDSGCTAVVALLAGQQLFVANAGDSRCVVCRSGAALEMSQDHKPEDEPEMQRILAAGGTVKEGRVNKGLNLSRAIGDFTYKKNESLPATEQMIIALPDVKKLEIDPAQDEFMVLACDGIWNSMTSQEVVDFVKPKLEEGLPVSKICEQMFDHCLAPNTLGDGTGCDNMTCIIVKFKDAKSHAAEKRRAASPGAAEAKRQKTEEETAAAAKPATA